jgi:tetratricopeptide (TPR) repeat protein
LNSEHTFWSRQQQSGTLEDQSRAARALRAWQEQPELACLRDPAALAKLPGAEAKQWQDLWAAVRARAEYDPVAALGEARALVAVKDWARAAPVYARLVKESRTTEGEIWFEYAAAQLLSGDAAGYRQSCKFMLDAGGGKKMRGYLAARACTLAADPAVDVARAAQVSAGELKSKAGAFWSLTERGALCYRAGQFQEALPLFADSLGAEPRPGAAVLNWLWLALAHHQLGQAAEARSRLKMAGDWLDALGNQWPANAETALNLHRHNWLEAHILRREAEALLSPK